MAKYEKRGKYLPTLHEATCDNYFIVKCLLKSNVARVILLAYYFNANLVDTKIESANLNLHSISICIFRYEYFVVYFVCLIDLLSNVLFQTFQTINFENTYLLSCWFYCVDIFYIEFGFCETFTVINSVTRILLIKTLYKFRTIECWFTRVLIYPIPTHAFLG